MLFSAKNASFYDADASNLPDDAIDVSDDLYREYGPVAAPLGYLRGADKNGLPCWVALPSDPPGIRRARTIDWIDATADRIRASDRSVGQYLDAEYQVVADALVVYRANPDGEVPDAIQSYATAEGLTVEQAAEQIAEAAARADELLQAVRRIRLAGKAAIRDAGDDADFMETARPFIDQLEALATT